MSTFCVQYALEDKRSHEKAQQNNKSEKNGTSFKV